MLLVFSERYVMNGKPAYLLDTCFILGFYNKSAIALQMLAEHKVRLSECAISVINRIEILGYTELTLSDETNLRKILESFICLPLSVEVEMMTISLRKKHKIKLPDSIILATAEVHGLKLLTLDQKLNNYSQN